jgi:hypothetical protein
MRCRTRKYTYLHVGCVQGMTFWELVNVFRRKELMADFFAVCALDLKDWRDQCNVQLCMCI